MVLLGTIAVALVAFGVVWSIERRPTTRANPGAPVKAATSVDFDYVVSPGTAERVRAGEPMTVMPEVLTAKVGQVIRIDNRDSEASDVGPFRVPARSVLTQRFTKAGTFIGRCVLSPTGSARIIVAA